MGLLVQGKAPQQEHLPMSWVGITWILAQCIGQLLWQHWAHL